MRMAVAVTAAVDRTAPVVVRLLQVVEKTVVGHRIVERVRTGSRLRVQEGLPCCHISPRQRAVELEPSRKV